MAMTPQVQAAIRGFNDIILGGVPLLLRQNETAFLPFMCSVAAIDALSGYPYTTDKVGDRFKSFIKEYFPAYCGPHVDNLYLYRCRIPHNFSSAYFTLTHLNQSVHLQTSPIGDTVLSDAEFFADVASAARKFFSEVQTDATRQDAMNARLLNKERCKKIKSQNYGGFAGFQYIIPIQRGKMIEESGGFDNQPRTPSVWLKNTAVHFNFFGKASIAYYWDLKINNFSDITAGD
jgi:hypothetical protein